jgi:hypothetical protein
VKGEKESAGVKTKVLLKWSAESCSLTHSPVAFRTVGFRVNGRFTEETTNKGGLKTVSRFSLIPFSFKRQQNFQSKTKDVTINWH